VDPAAVLREARRRAGLSQRALARRVGVPQPTVARIESGATVPRVDTLDRLLAACGSSLAVRPSGGAGVDRTAIRAILALPPAERLRLAAADARNLDRFLAGAGVR
jgi:transcriptional regulator with XRE-family HTH domain